MHNTLLNKVNLTWAISA